MADLPRPAVEVTSREDDGSDDSVPAGQKVDVTITRPGAGAARKYEGGKTGGYSRDGAIKEVVEKIIADPATAEWLPAPKKG